MGKRRDTADAEDRLARFRPIRWTMEQRRLMAQMETADRSFGVGPAALPSTTTDQEVSNG